MAGGLRALEKFLLKETLSGKKGAKELADMAEARGRLSIMDRIHRAQNPDLITSEKTAQMLNEAASGVQKAEESARSKAKSGHISQEMYDEVGKRFKRLFGDG